MKDTVIKKLDIRTISRSDFDAAYFLMDEKRKEKCSGYKNDSDKKLCIAADMLLRKALSEIFSVNEKDFVFDVDERGKPYLVNYYCNFNISHSGDYIAICINKNKRVGIDIEKIRPVKRTLIERVCAEEEKQYIFSGFEIKGSSFDEKELCERFFRVWTYKEAILKLTGEGIRGNLKEIVFSPEDCLTEISDGYCMTVICDE